MIETRLPLLLAGSLFWTALGTTPALAAIDWTSVPAKDIVLFYPGQTSWDWLLSATAQEGTDRTHSGDDKFIGAILVPKKPDQASSVAGRSDSIAAKVKFAHDEENIYVHLEFAEDTQHKITTDTDAETKVALIIDDDGNKIKPAVEVIRPISDKDSPEYWQVKMAPSSAPVAANGHILGNREEAKPAVIKVEASENAGMWSVTFTRKLNAGPNFNKIVTGKPYTVGFVLHSGHATKHFHYVSFEHSLVLDRGEADFIAARY